MSVLDKFLDAIRLNDDFDDDDEFFDDDELEALEDEKPKHRFFKKLEDDLDNEEDEEETYVKPAKKDPYSRLKAAFGFRSQNSETAAENSSFLFQDYTDAEQKARYGK